MSVYLRREVDTKESSLVRSSLSFRSEIVKETKNKRVSVKSFRPPRSLVYFCKGIPGLANPI